MNDELRRRIIALASENKAKDMERYGGRPEGLSPVNSDVNFDKELNRQVRDNYDERMDYIWSVLADNPELQKNPELIEHLNEATKNEKVVEDLKRDTLKEFLDNKKLEPYKFDRDI